jgi:hypothetical protein
MKPRAICSAVEALARDKATAVRRANNLAKRLEESENIKLGLQARVLELETVIAKNVRVLRINRTSVHTPYLRRVTNEFNRVLGHAPLPIESSVPQ